MQSQQGNPFGAPSPYPGSPTGTTDYQQQQQQQQSPQQQQQQQMPPQMGNPFDPMMTGQPQPHAQGESFGAKQEPSAENPFGASSPPPPQQQQNYTPYGGAPPQGQSMALIPSQYQSNPYAVPTQQGGYPYGAPPPQQQQHAPSQGNGGGGGNPFDPFAPPPPPAPAPPPPAPVASPYPPQQQQQQHFDNASPASGNPYGDQSSQHPYDAPPQSQPPPAFHQQQPPAPPPEPPHTERSYDAPRRPEPPSRLQQQPPRGEADMYDMDSPGSAQSNETRNRYAEELAQNAPPGASPLPKADLVRKKGFVLSRISFRTIVMKKWKQAFWVQYGPHTMLWFRSQADFDDWLNNPYHNQAQRNFLIKLAVNFVHDLYKPSVRGYQVTQCRTKAYGNKMIRQFKLERWMDYGPTIAAAFGSYNPKEVDDLREALVECMRNTPLSGGIRATGAVRQPQGHPTESRPFSYDNNHSNDDGNNRGDYPRDRDYEESPPPTGQQQQTPAQNGSAPQAGDSVVEETDLLDLENWDDVPGHGGPPPPGTAPYQQGGPPPQSSYQQGPPQSPYQPGPPPGASPYHQGPAAGYPGGYPPQQQQQQQDPNYAGAIVPVQPGAPVPYPGAPAYPGTQYPGAPSPYGAPHGGWQGQPPQQQQQQQPPYGHPQPYQQPGF